MLDRCSLGLIATLLLVQAHACVYAHEGPDPRAAWFFEEASLDGKRLKAQAGPDLFTNGRPPRTEAIGRKSCLRLDGNESYFTTNETWTKTREYLPNEAMTISAWVSLDAKIPLGGILSAFQDNGNAETGIVLGYNEQSFYFGLAAEGADDGDGKLTYLNGSTVIDCGRWYHVCAVYDGSRMQLWVNGQLDAESSEQSGKVLYPDDGNLVVGAYHDRNESFSMDGRLGQVTLYDLAAKPAWIAHDYAHHKAWTSLPAKLDASKSFEFLVKPYLQFATTSSIRVLCEVNRPASVTVEYGETSLFTESVSATSEDRLLHTAILENLKPETGYYYQVVVQEDGQPDEVRSDLGSFQTASRPTTPFAFTVIADTQGNPAVNGQLAKHAWGLRPNFLIMPGDLVDDGPQKRQWVQEFFASMNPLFARVPFYPVLGNHERDASHYYRYMDLPPPEYYYTFQYGNARFFMIDSNKNLDPDSEQYRWLEKELEGLKRAETEGDASVVWKFVSFHHPAYSSDEDDYGNLWKGKSTWGDLRLRPMTELFDRYQIDIVWNGHIHSYERTWPIYRGTAIESGGTMYMITGGGGGGLEQAGPIRPGFQNNVRRGHHFVYVAIHGKTLELKAYDLEGVVFDSVTIHK